MVRAMTCWAAAALLAVMAGCTMCDHPYDYAGPTYDGPCPGAPGARAGSILAPGSMETSVIGSEQIISVNDTSARPPAAAEAATQAPLIPNP
jgi:hypothetical protein